MVLTMVNSLPSSIIVHPQTIPVCQKSMHLFQRSQMEGVWTTNWTFRRFTDENTTNKSPNGFFRSRCDQDPSAVMPIPKFDPNENCFSLLLENGGQITKKDNQLHNRNSKPKVELLIDYSIDQQIFKFKAIIRHKDPLETINLDDLNNLELWEQLLI